LESQVQLWHWLVLGGSVIVLFALDFVVFPRLAREESMRRAVIESVFWIAAGLGFTGFVWAAFNGQRGIEYLTAYVIEKSLSADNLFVFAVTFEYFRIQQQHQRRVLFFGIAGAVVLRGIFIFGGLALLDAVEWVVYVFGGLLLLTGIRLGIKTLRHEEEHGGENAVVRWVASVLPVDRNTRTALFWYRSPSGICLTPMALALIAIESADIMFAVDSVPAVLAVTRDRYVAYTSNIFAVLGLRALYSVLAHGIRELPLIRPALSLILILVGVKLLLAQVVEIPVWIPLAAVGGLLAAAIAGSIWLKRRGGPQTQRRRRAA
jgi:tellurite resistance protein TerC